MISAGIAFRNFKNKKKTSTLKIKQTLKLLIKEENEVIKSLKKSYKDSFSRKNLKRYKKSKYFRVIGMGGSTLGTQAIYQFLKKNIKKDFVFVDNLQTNTNIDIKKKCINIIVSKSGNTIETIANTNFYLNNSNQNIFITENNKNHLFLLAKKLKSEIIHHNNFIGGRYSVLSEVGMLPADLMGLDSSKFRQLNLLINNKKFFNSLVSNVSSTVQLIKKKKFNSIIINYDEKSINLFKWYQQLIAESLGKKKKGLLPVISTMPKDNHSVMQFYLDGLQNNFFTFFYVKETNSKKIKNRYMLPSLNFLKEKNLSDIMYAQKEATEVVFRKKNIPFRSFEIKKRDEKTLGELFCFFILETILLGKCLNLNPYDQPAVELIKQETKKILI